MDDEQKKMETEKTLEEKMKKYDNQLWDGGYQMRPYSGSQYTGFRTDPQIGLALKEVIHRETDRRVALYDVTVFVGALMAPKPGFRKPWPSSYNANELRPDYAFKKN